MSTFSYAIKMAIILFPIVALIFTIPYIIYQYHKYGSISSYRSIIVYSFLLYLMSAYFLVILPLPSIETVSQMTTPSYNLIPFHFISEILSLSTFSASDFATYFPTLQNPTVYESLFNIILTVPFGIYLHYYFEFDFKKTVFYTFCLTLFFEITQLSGLYFIYPRGYRVFDVDDLILNTLGGIIGYFLAFIPIKFLPTRKEIDEESKEKAKSVSILKRSMTFLIDFLLYSVFLIATIYLVHNYINDSLLLKIGIGIIWTIFYYLILPNILKGRTLGMKFFHLRFYSDKKIAWYRIVNYYFWKLFIYVFIPIFLLFTGYILWRNKYISTNFFEYYGIVVAALTLMMFLIALLKRIFGMPLSYEKISYVTLISNMEYTEKSQE